MSPNFGNKVVVYFGPRIEYLEREQGWQHSSTFQFEGKSKGYSRVYLIGENLNEVISLFRLRDRFSVYLYADETYKVFRTLLLCFNPKIVNIIRSYPIHDLKFPKFGKLIEDSFSANRIMKSNTSNYQNNFFEIALSLIAGVVMSVRQVALNFTERIRFRGKMQNRWMPLGYTNVFASNFVAYLQPSQIFEGSLIDLFLLNKLKIFESKMNKIVFRGQVGKFQRQFFFREFETISLPIANQIVLNERFSGSSNAAEPRSEMANAYVRELLESAFAMCPPGNYSNETFRFWESLLCGCVPIVANFVPSDPIRGRGGVSLREFCELVFSSEKKHFGSKMTGLVLNQVELWKEQCENVNEYIKMS